MRTLIALVVAGLLPALPCHAASADDLSLQRVRAGLRDTHPVAVGPIASAVKRTPPGRPGRDAGLSRREARASRQVISAGRDSIWNGLLIGAGIGAGAGYLWAQHICGSNDAECSAIVNPVGMLGGAGIGAAVGAVLDALTK